MCFDSCRRASSPALCSDTFQKVSTLSPRMSTQLGLPGAERPISRTRVVAAAMGACRDSALPECVQVCEQ